MNLRLREVVRGADLGSSSNYSDEIRPTFVGAFSFEDCSGEGFLVNGNQTRVSRS